MKNRRKIAEEFAEAVNSDKIISIILFGSVARGEDNKDSDIDILVISPYADELDDKIGEIAADFTLKTNELVYVHVMSEDHFNKTKNYPFLTNVLNDGVVLV